MSPVNRAALLCFQRGAKLWNSLNDNIKSLKCPRNFRRHLANVLLSWYILCNYNIIVLTFLINLYKFVYFILLSWKAHLGSINKVYVCNAAEPEGRRHRDCAWKASGTQGICPYALLLFSVSPWLSWPGWGAGEQGYGEKLARLGDLGG